MPDREQIDHWWGDDRFGGEATLPIARRLAACPTCGAKLNPERPSLTCHECGRPLDDSPVGRHDPTPKGEQT